jgi:hypothetical protein
MKTSISLARVCEHYRYEPELAIDFAAFGLFKADLSGGEPSIAAEDLDRLREVMSLHLALGINKEGIDVVLELRHRIYELEDAFEALRREHERLRYLAGLEDPEFSVTKIMEIDNE